MKAISLAIAAFSGLACTGLLFAGELESVEAMKPGSLLPLSSAGVLLAGVPESVEFLNSGKVLPPSLPFSEAVRVGDLLYLSGQIGIVPGTMQLVPGGIKVEARQALENIKVTLEAHGYSMRNVVKCTVMLADISEWGTFNEVYKAFFSAPYPARSALGVNGLALGARVEVECIAVVGKKKEGPVELNQE
jgi:reactive intermediate/imine deaminase